MNYSKAVLHILPKEVLITEKRKDHSFKCCNLIHLFRILSTGVAVGDRGQRTTQFCLLTHDTRSFIVCCSLTHFSS
jgi:hypothetical protein